jgi:catechol-2,3-dioxygenase
MAASIPSGACVSAGIYFPTIFAAEWSSSVLTARAARSHGVAWVAVHDDAPADAGSVMTMFAVSLLTTWLAVNVPEAVLPSGNVTLTPISAQDVRRNLAA